MPSMKATRLEASRARLLSHPALVGANGERNEAPRDHSRLLDVLFAQLAEGDRSIYQSAVSPEQTLVHGIPASMLADRATIALFAHPPSLSDPLWWTSLSSGMNTPSPEAIASIAVPPQNVPLFVPGTESVDAALIAAQSAQKTLELARRKARETSRLLQKASAAAEAARNSTAFPADWANLGSSVEPSSVPAFSGLKGRAVGRRERPAPSVCCFCPDIRHFGGTELASELMGPYVNSRGRPSLRAHFDCAVWAPKVYADRDTGQFVGVYDEYRRGRQLRCVGCCGKGATVGCYIEKCKRAFHFRCLGASGARKVNEFFVAFCSTHQHFADKDIYKEMMRVSSIADVASAHRESTDGLDCPHSKYTHLRRRDTEIIFSRCLGISSHTGVYEHRKELFSSARRKVMKSSDPLRVKELARVVRYSALDVATGYLALLAIGKTSESNAEEVCATQARAAIASRDHSSLFLLRNLEGARCWTPTEVRIAKPAAKRSQPFLERMRQSQRISSSDGGPRSMHEDVQNATLRASQEELTPNRDTFVKEDNSPSPRVTRSRLEASRRISRRGAQPTPSSTQQSARLPSRRSRVRNGISESKDDRGESVVEPNAVLMSSPVAPSETATGVLAPLAVQDTIIPSSISTPVQSLPRGPPLPSLFVRKGHRTAWDEFLAEQYPRERSVRPEDDHKTAMGNLARMWSLLTAVERSKYETLTSRPFTPVLREPITSVAHAGPSNKRPAVRTDHVSAGLFSSTPMKRPMSESGIPDRTRKRPKSSRLADEECLKPPSTSMAMRRGRRREHSRLHEADQQPDWDALFPMDLVSTDPPADNSEESGMECVQAGRGEGTKGVLRPPRVKKR